MYENHPTRGGQPNKVKDDQARVHQLLKETRKNLEQEEQQSCEEGRTQFTEANRTATDQARRLRSSESRLETMVTTFILAQK